MSSPLERAALVTRLRERFDLAVIGGGINGAAIARDAALRGLSVVLVDKGDFAGATSSRSSKLIHGGLRYLPQGHIRLVYQALRERERLRRFTAPHLVRPLRFLMPFYRGHRPGGRAIALGLTLYDLIAWTPRSERHRRISAAEALQLEPRLQSDGLIGGATYFDAGGDDARLTLENLVDTADHGGVPLNYAAVESLTINDGQYRVLAVRDIVSGTLINVNAKAIVNAAGPWVDVIRRIDNPGCGPLVRLTKGVHLVVAAARLPVRNPLVLTDHAGRIVFVIPDEDYLLIGTTDTDFDADPEQVGVEPADVSYLLDVVNAAFPAARLLPDDVVYGFAGLRALPRVVVGSNPSVVPREEVIEPSASGMITVAGGKLTTHRAIAQKVVDGIVRQVGRPGLRSITSRVALPGARPLDETDHAANSPWEALVPGWRMRLEARYGSRARIVAGIAAERTELAQPLAPGATAIGAEVVFAARYELARTVEDFLVRRTAMVWRAPAAAVASAPAVARLLAVELGWDDVVSASAASNFTDSLRAGWGN